MTRTRNGTAPNRVAWTPFYEVTHGQNRVTGQRTPVPDGERFYGNSLYNVFVKPVGDGIVWLSISRKDRKTVRDWRDLQRIKNELVGPECEGAELFPAESRLVDTSNQFHLFVLTDPAIRFPFGYTRREVMTPEQLATDPAGIGAVQRPFPADHLFTQPPKGPNP